MRLCDDSTGDACGFTVYIAARRVDVSSNCR